MSKVSIVIPVKNPGSEFRKTLEMIYAQKFPGQFEVVVVDSGVKQKTSEIIQGYPVRLYSIRSEDFRHGKTRNLGVSLAKGEYLVFTTQDAVPVTDRWLVNLIRNLETPGAAGAYGRQIPKEETKPMERFFLNKMYPEERRVQRLDGNTAPGWKTIFFSDVNSAIRKDVLTEYPFDDYIITGEDQEWAKRVLLAGYCLIYDPEAPVYHSHDFSLKSVLQRYFDAGVSIGQYAKSEYAFNRFTGDGLRYVKEEMGFLVKSGYTRWLPYALAYDFCKFTGLFLGKHQNLLPLSFKARLSTNKYYWK